MRKLKIIEHISLDGVIQHSADDGDFPYSDWTAPYRTPAGRDAVTAAYGESFDLLLGRRTYDIWSGFWPTAPSSPIAHRLNAATKYVATHRPESLEWGPFEDLGPDIVEGIRRVKSQGGRDLILSGSSTLTSTVLEHGLADEVVLIVSPVLLGTGKRFFAEGAPARSFELVSTQATPSGVILSTYKVAARGCIKKKGADDDEVPLSIYCYYFTASFSDLPEVNFGIFAAGMVITSPVLGLRPFLDFLFVTEKVPNPTSVTFCPFFNADLTASG